MEAPRVHTSLLGWTLQIWVFSDISFLAVVSLTLGSCTTQLVRLAHKSVLIPGVKAAVNAQQSFLLHHI